MQDFVFMSYQHVFTVTLWVNGRMLSLVVLQLGRARGAGGCRADGQHNSPAVMDAL